MDNLKICFVTSLKSKTGGISRWFSCISKSLFEKGIDYVSISTDLRNEFKKRSFFDRFIVSFFKTFGQKRQLKNYIKTNSCNVLHVASSGKLGFFRDYILLKTAKKSKMPTFLHLHFGRIDEVVKSHSFENKLFKKCLRYTDAVIAIDKNSYDTLQAQRINAFLIPNPVDEQAYSFNVDSKQFVFVGHIEKQKGVFELIDSFKMCQNNLGWSLFFVGSIDRNIKTIFNDGLGEKIKYLGILPHEETLDIISKSSVLVLPSYTEGMPNVVLEAMSFGIPVIASDVGNLKNMLGEEFNCLIPPKNVPALKASMETMMENKVFREKSSIFNYSKCKKEYYSRIVVEKLINVWMSFYDIKR